MNRIKRVALIIVAGAALSATQVFATPIPINTTGANGEQTLQEVLDGITVSGPNCPGGAGPTCHSSVNVHTDQISPNSYWAIQGSGGSVTQMIIEITANAGFNSFGIFDAANSGNTFQLFDGSATPTSGGKFTFGFRADGTIVDGTDTPLGGTFAGNLFGYYLDTPNGIFYSDPNLNTDGNAHHQVAYRGGDGDHIQVGNSAPGLFGGDEYIFGWEDSPSTAWDFDYNDFVVLAESINPVPEPSMLLMFGLGLLAVGSFMGLTRQRD